ncbi:TrbC/VirB2 family protein [Brevundimonas sp. NPDC090276]|uniref:TrbC/VirB2 family protein n=1 Tax=Brevundimonas sp. NPDC090276 TaxID=3363956 RepID=UPI00383AD583
MTLGVATGSAAPNVFLAGTQWVQELLLGPVATSIAVIAVASLGLLMLSGRMNIRRAATVIVGCFILFGAASIAQGLHGVSLAFTGKAPRPQSILAPLPPSIDALSSQPKQTDGPADPYAGASVRR